MKLRIHALGASVDVGITGDLAEPLAAGMRELWSRCLVPIETTVEGEPISYEATHANAPETVGLTQEITRRLIAAQRGRLLMLHAGAVSDPNGNAAVFVAPGGTGKTTLSALLGKTHGYLTDETVAVDRAGRVLPYPKPLSVRHGDMKREYAPEALGLLPAHPNPTVRRVVLLTRDGEDRAEQLSEIDAICALSPETSSLAELPAGLHRLRELLSVTGPVVRYHYSEASEIADLVVADL